MWWITKNGTVSGPFSREQIEKRIGLGMIGSLDRVSEDRKSWMYIRDSEFWHQERTLPENLPPPSPVGGRKIGLASRRAPAPPVAAPIITSVPIADVDSSPKPVYHPCGTNGGSPANSHKGRGVLMIIAASVTGAIIVAGAVILAFTLLRKTNETSGRSVGTSKSSFQAAQDKLVIIECGGGSGSGFLAKMDGKVYLVSNEHVLRGAGSPKATLLNGETLTLGAFSVAEDRDLARFEIPGATKGFEISTTAPTMHDFCAIYGNSVGHGVATELHGEIVGQGGKYLETDAEFVNGNSGSPVINSKGDIVGAADLVVFDDQFAERAAAEGNTGIKGTKFDKVRRFIVRLDGNVKWKSIDRDAYEYQAYVFGNVQLFVNTLMPFLLFDDPKNPLDDPVFSKADANLLFGKDTFGFAESLLAISDTIEKGGITLERWQSVIAGYGELHDKLVANGVDERTIQNRLSEYATTNDLPGLWDKLKSKLQTLVLKRRQALAQIKTVLSETEWTAPQFLHGHEVEDKSPSVLGYRDFVMVWDELMQQRMRDWEKNFKLTEGRYDDED